MNQKELEKAIKNNLKDTMNEAPYILWIEKTRFFVIGNGTVYLIAKDEWSARIISYKSIIEMLYNTAKEVLKKDVTIRCCYYDEDGKIIVIKEDKK